MFHPLYVSLSDRIGSRRKTSTPSGTRRIKPYEIYRYADRTDVALMIIGSIAGKHSSLSFSVAEGIVFSAMIAGSLYPLLLMLYRRVMDSLVDLAHLRTDNATSINITGRTWFALFCFRHRLSFSLRSVAVWWRRTTSTVIIDHRTMSFSRR